MRTLTDNERAVLAHMVVDPDAWWVHANAVEKIDHEAALAAKVKRWQGAYDVEKVVPGYATRKQREDENKLEADTKI